MIYSVSGRLAAKGATFVVVEAGGVGFKIFTPRRLLGGLRAPSDSIKLFCCLHMREDALELYGFAETEELDFFEMLISVGGVGPKSALAILDVAELKNLTAAIKEGRADLLTRASGIGRKPAERIILELRGRVQAPHAEGAVRAMESDADLVETLTGLGYRRDQAKQALSRVDEKLTGLEERFKAALKLLGGKGK
ncbi:MAG: Holliday junction DNA helicase RuvA [Candidatus Liptonbacteria bacterium RIFCSPLOWO2_01_FULL_56_20]|uniref:Holliday junction branch migration complex subunit RuvA n=1 Tax=Candidatus Liptonbacteria bacterium RIFCSPLOWO2_01_FULL_56_20 TaxID=1798652 RepID=A0A1G2CJ51_9BACT|nr:MAG: Holliday junction DNA helicase RuvA [Candidatus Liptonbacteria bacterium RIFCSPLOWO2_01_FULL_56_20]